VERDVLADAAGSTGSLEVFGGPELLDELTHTALLRCRELVASPSKGTPRRGNCRSRPPTMRSPGSPIAACCCPAWPTA
jgi:hypothetical protein